MCAWQTRGWGTGRQPPLGPSSCSRRHHSGPQHPLPGAPHVRASKGMKEGPCPPAWWSRAGHAWDRCQQRRFSPSIQGRSPHTPSAMPSAVRRGGPQRMSTPLASSMLCIQLPAQKWRFLCEKNCWKRVSAMLIVGSGRGGGGVSLSA